MTTIPGIEEQHGTHQAESTHPPGEGSHRMPQEGPTGTGGQSTQQRRASWMSLGMMAASASGLKLIHDQYIYMGIIIVVLVVIE